MCSKIGAAQVAAASTCTGLSEPRWLPAEDVSGENLTVWEAGVRQRGSTSEITNVPRSRVRQSGSRRSLPLCRPSATQSRARCSSRRRSTRGVTLDHTANRTAIGLREGNSAHAGWRAGGFMLHTCERATQRMRGGGLAASCCTRARGQLSACGVASCCAAVRCAVCAC